MEDIVQIIIVVGIIIVPLLKKLLETPTDESNGPIEVEEHPAPPSDSVPVTDFVPPSPQPVHPKRHKSAKPKPHEKPSPPEKTQMKTELDDEPESEFAIRSQEEARKAIIWSEILQRKHFGN